MDAYYPGREEMKDVDYLSGRVCAIRNVNVMVAVKLLYFFADLTY